MPGFPVPSGAVEYGQGGQTIQRTPSRLALEHSLFEPPSEGPCQIPGYLKYDTDSTVIHFNAAGNSVGPMSRICAMWVNAVFCTVDVQLLFPDTGFCLVVPAGAQGLFEVETGLTDFYIQAPGAASQDSLYFNVYNFVPRPQSIPKSVFNSTVSVAGINLVSGPTVLVAAGFAGIITSLQVKNIGTLTGGGGGGSTTITVQDGSGTPVVIDVGEMNIPVINTFVAPSFLINLSGLNIRYNNGLNLVQVVTGAGNLSGALIATVAHRESIQP